MPKFYAASIGGVRIVEKEIKSMIVCEKTGTTMYLGQGVRDFLKSEEFLHQTQIAVPPGCEIKITNLQKQPSEDLTVSKPGTIFLAPGTRARVEILSGTPQVFTTEKNLPESEREMPCDMTFAKNTSVNLHSYNLDIKRSRIPEELIEILKENYLMEEVKTEDNLDRDYFRYVRFKGKTLKEFEEGIESIGMEEEQIKLLSAEFQKALKRRKQHQKIGEVSKSTIEEIVDQAVLELLKKKKVLFDSDNPGEMVWGFFRNDESLGVVLSSLGIGPVEKEKLKEKWKATAKSGYDYSGIVYCKNGITVTDLDKKMNIYAQGKTEWSMNSTHYTCSAGDTLQRNIIQPIGGSSYLQRKIPESQVLLKTIRPAEAFHKHSGQIEVYHIVEGYSSIIVGTRHPRVNGMYVHKDLLMSPGDTLLIETNTPHMVVALGGKYCHFCMQPESIFHKDGNKESVDWGHVLKPSVTQEQFDRCRDRDRGNISVCEHELARDICRLIASTSHYDSLKRFIGETPKETTKGVSREII